MIEEMKQGFDTLKQVLLGTDEAPKDAVSLLKEDHRKVEELFKQFEESEEKAQRRSLLNEIIMELTVHASLEEKFVYPLLFSEETEDKTKEAFEEHHVVKLLLTELDGFTGGEDNIKAKVKVLSEMVKHHIKEEELDLLPKLKDHGVDTDELGSTLKEEKKNFTHQLESLKKQAANEAKQALGAGNGSGKAAAKTAAKPKIAKSKPAQKSKTAAKKSASKGGSRAAGSKTKSSSRETASKKTATAGGAKKTAAKKPTAKKAADKKTADKKAQSKKPAAKKPASKKAATSGGAKKTAAKKTGSKKTATKKSAPKMMASSKSKTTSKTTSMNKSKKRSPSLKKAS